MKSKQIVNIDAWLDILNGSKQADSNNVEEEKIAAIRRLILKKEKKRVEMPSDCELRKERKHFLQYLNLDYEIKNKREYKWYFHVLSKLHIDIKNWMPIVGAISLISLVGIVIYPSIFSESEVRKHPIELTSDMRYKGDEKGSIIKIITTKKPKEESEKLALKLKITEKNVVYTKNNGSYLIKLRKPVSEKTQKILEEHNIVFDSWKNLKIVFMEKSTTELD